MNKLLKQKRIMVSLILIILIAAAVSLFVYIKNDRQSQSGEVDPTSSNFITGGEMTQEAKDSHFYSNIPPSKPVTINVPICEKGRDSVYFGIGHTEFNVSGIKGSYCNFNYGTEIENPVWNRELDTQCSIPTSSKIILSVNDDGIDFLPISNYCSKI